MGLIGEIRCTNAQIRKTKALNSQNTLHSQIFGEEQTQPSWTLLLFNGIFSHLQRHLHTKLHPPVNKAQHALPSSFTKLLVVILFMLSLAGLSPLQCYAFPLLSPCTSSICPSPSILSGQFLCCSLQSSPQSGTGQHTSCQSKPTWRGLGSVALDSCTLPQHPLEQPVNTQQATQLQLPTSHTY